MFGLVREEIDVQSMTRSLVRLDDGAVAVFEGVVRDNSRGKKVLYLEYHAYESMALKKLEEVGRRAKEGFDIHEIGILHRLGRLKLSECSVAIVVTSAHRGPAFEACRFAIDTLKKIVPIWKKEFYEDGAVWIEGGN